MEKIDVFIEVPKRVPHQTGLFLVDPGNFDVDSAFRHVDPTTVARFQHQYPAPIRGGLAGGFETDSLALSHADELMK